MNHYTCQNRGHRWDSQEEAFWCFWWSGPQGGPEWSQGSSPAPPRSKPYLKCKNEITRGTQHTVKFLYLDFLYLAGGISETSPRAKLQIWQACIWSVSISRVGARRHQYNYSLSAGTDLAGARPRSAANAKKMIFGICIFGGRRMQFCLAKLKNRNIKYWL